jgi:broad specificity phosphatase PhoE
MRIYLLRHGVTPYNKKKIIQGHLDIPLSEEGIEQAQDTAGKLLEEIGRDNLQICHIYTSDLSRASQTADILRELLKTKGIEPPISHRKDLREIFLNTWEGKSKKELFEDLEEDGISLFQKWIEKPALVVPEGAESMTDFYFRCIDALSDIMNNLREYDQKNCAAVIYTHGGFLSMIRNYLNDRDPANFIGFAHPNAGGIAIEANLPVYAGGRFDPSVVKSFRQFPDDFDPVENLLDPVTM